MPKKKIHVINYGFGNLASVKNALEYLNFKCKIIRNPKKNKNVSLIIIPGVGSYEAGKSDHFSIALKNTLVSSVITANLFNFLGNGLKLVRQRLIEDRIKIAKFY